MHVNIKIKCDNAAFSETPEFELSRILESISEDILGNGIRNKSILDYNGNVVGELEVSE